MPFSNVVGHQRFEELRCIHLQDETFISYHITTLRHNLEDRDLHLPRCGNLKYRPLPVSFTEIFIL
jgi:hypothetical protein